jgi:hypothetical protein
MEGLKKLDLAKLETENQQLYRQLSPFGGSRLESACRAGRL